MSVQMSSFAIKSGVVSSTIYWSREYKVWGSSKDTAKLYGQLSAQADPSFKKLKSQIPIDVSAHIFRVIYGSNDKHYILQVPLLPSSGEACFLVKHYYNNGVKNTIHFIHRFPCYLGQWAKKAQDTINSALDAPPVKQ